jgi:hypothetical protein
MYKFKKYVQSIQLKRGLYSDKLYKVINRETYRGYGRPKKEDYEYLTDVEIYNRFQERLEKAITASLCEIFSNKA